ncbi:Hyoscyamine 6-dioxygenase [Panicum miliaceum]|uniref:Hyoscyamine 6-dioxygenase n=1 Tax=Panicum miliaceum TaxID=4540 RepID=A0A3L6QM41_PANMI|nr:Hyoscyamine 6-dioxygenase [Panicum miliaceum]
MDELLSNTPVYHAVPDEYVFPPEKRPANDQLLDPTITLPVIDLADVHTVDEIIHAGKEFGFFQVIIPKLVDFFFVPGRARMIPSFRDAAVEFFALPPEEKLPYCSDDQSKPFRVASSTTYDRRETRYWRDYLKLQCFPVHKFLPHWPARPGRFRESLAEYIVQVQRLAETLLRATSAGLQARHQGRWIAVEPIPNAFVINFGHQMEIVTNGLLKSVEHRAVTNSAAARMSVATLIMPEMECRIAPAPELVGGAPKFRPFVFREFMEAYAAAAASREDVLNRFSIRPSEAEAEATRAE